MESEETVQLDKQKYVEDLYAELERMAEAGEVADAWGDETLLEFYDLMVRELYPIQKDAPEWVFMFEQIYNWQFQSCHEGVYTFYGNLYEVDTDDGIRRLSDCLYRHGYMETAKWYDYGIFDHNLYPEFGYPAEYGLKMGEIDQWIGENTETIWHIYLDLLQGHKKDLLEAAANWEPECKVEEENEEILSSAVQQKKEIAFQSFLNLDVIGSSEGGKISRLAASQIDDKMLSQMVEAKELERIQTTQAFSKEALRLLDEKLFSNREDIMFRIYGLHKGDLQHFADMVHVQKIGLDCMEDIEHIEVLSQFAHLKELDMHLSGRRDYSFVNRLSPGLKALSLYADFSQEGVTFGDTSLYEMKWMLRYPDLRCFYIGNPKQHIEFLIRKDSVRELILYEMPCPPSEVLHMLDVQSVIIHQEHVRGLEKLEQMDSLQEIQLVKITDINHLDFLKNIPALQKVTLRSLPGLTSLPHFPEGQKLLEFAVYDCEKLTDMSTVNEAAKKWFVRQYSAGAGSTAGV
ncbi:MAG: hypothetical protein K2N44_15435 [Lachnospiraceae bacterium]|nr:hypothetical protein [Lachnospiraceae bacterium]